MKTSPPLYGPVAVVLALGVVGGAGAGLYLRTQNADAERAQLRFIEERATSQLRERMQIYSYGLRGTRGAMISAGDRLSRELFHRYMMSRDLTREFPGSLGYGFIRRVAPEAEAQFVADARRDGAPDFAIQALTAHAGDRFVIQYIEPVAENRSAIGLDIASEAHRRAAAIDAMATGKTTLTAPISLVQLAERTAGFLMLLPVYRQGAGPASGSADDVIGWVYAPIAINRVLADFDYRSGEFTLRIADVSRDSSLPIFTSPGHVDADVVVRTVLEFHGRVWSIELHPTEVFFAQLNQASPVVVGGSILTFAVLLAGLLYTAQAGLRRRLRLGAERDQLAAILEASSDAIIATDVHSIVTSWNAGAWRLLGYTAGEVLGEPIAILRPAEYGEPALRCERADRIEVELVTHDARTVNVSLTVAPVEDPGGAVVAWSFTARDTSEHHHAQAALRASESRFRELNDDLEARVLARTDELRATNTQLEAVVAELRHTEQALRSAEGLQRGILAHAGSSIIATDCDGTITLFNRAAEELLGYASAELVGRASPAMIHDPAEVAARRDALHRELGFPIELAFDVVVFKARPGKPDAREWTYLRKDGSRVPVLVTVSVLRDDAGDAFGYLSVAVDLTLRKRQEDELVNLNRLLSERSVQAESASHAKSMFLANMSHEIRTPMNAITGVIYLLKQTELSPDQQSLVQTLQSGTKTLLGMINDILDLSKIEAQQLTLDEVPFQLSRILDDIGAMMTALAAEKRLELVIECDSGAPDHLIGDPMRLAQILTNLVGNAIKFTEHGTVRLAVRTEAGDAERSWLRFEVHDSGPGMDDALRGRLFKPFTQGDRSGARRVGGTGLGLSIVKQLAILMGGEVGVESVLGSGSQFWCRIPFAHAAAGDAPAWPIDLDILIVEPHPAQRASLVSSAHRLGWRTHDMASYDGVVELVHHRARTGQPFDAIVLDCSPPGTRGLEVLAQIRGLQALERQPTVVVTTTHDLGAMTAQSARRADAVLGKPITGSSLFDAISSAVGVRTVAAPSEREVQSERGQRLVGLRLLVVDDSKLNQIVVSRIMELEGAQVEIAGNGVQAVARVFAGPPFDAVLMDVQMPEMDGIAATRQIRELAAYARLPIIAVTAGAQPVERAVALEAGVNEVISKPFDPEVVVASVRRYVARARGRSNSIAPSTAPSTAPSLGPSIAPSVAPSIASSIVSSIASPIAPEPVAASRPVASDDIAPRAVVRARSIGLTPPHARATPWPAVDGIDSHDAEHRLAGDVETFHELLRLFLEDLDEVDAALAEPLIGDRLTPLAQRMHKLRGTAGNLGARDLFAAASETEQALVAGQLAAAEAGVRRVIDQLGRLRRSAAALVGAPGGPGESLDRDLGGIDRDIDRSLDRSLDHDIDRSLDPGRRHSIDPVALAALVRSLHDHDLAALRSFDALSPALADALGAAAHARMCKLVAHLEFDAALDIVRQLAAAQAGAPA